MEVRRLTTLHKEYEKIVEIEMQNLKAKVRKAIYNLTQEKHGVSNRHL